MLYEDNYLAHFGIKGMRWGVRRFTDENGNLTAAGKERYGISVDTLKEKIVSGGEEGAANRVATLPQSETKPKKKKKLSEMTDQELREQLNRMQMEKQYNQLLAEQKGKGQSGGNQQPQQDNRTFGQKHPLIQQVLLNTAQNLVTKQVQVALDEVLAPKRRERAIRKGMTDPDLVKYTYYGRKKG